MSRISKAEECLLSPLAWITSYMHLAHMRLISNWFRRSHGERLDYDIFDRVVALWISFDAWID
jgi:hypothetical protein